MRIRDLFRCKYQEVYAYRTRHPFLPFVTRWGYVGRTCSPTLRDGQHAQGKRWYPLVTRRVVVVRFRHCPVFLIAACEWLAIKALMPVYNVQHNRANPRRVKPWQVGTLAELRSFVPALLVAAGLIVWSMT